MDCIHLRRISLTTIQDNTILKPALAGAVADVRLTTIQDNTILKHVTERAFLSWSLTTIQDNTILKPQIEYFCAPHAEIRMTVKRILMVL